MCRSTEHPGQRGIGLIEILLALVLVSVGFLAAARMQLEGMRFSQSAYFRSQAYFLASEMIDRMRANVDAVDDGKYSGQSISRSAVDPGCNDRICLPADIARQDLYDWSASILAIGDEDGVVGALPTAPDQDPTGTIVALADNGYTVTLTWPEIIGGELDTETLSVTFTSESR